MIRNVLLFVVLLTAACGPPPPDRLDHKSIEPDLVAQVSGTDQLLIGIDAVDERVVWASGTGGTYTRTTDGGASWQPGTVPGADTLQFRDVHAVNENVAYLLSIGAGTASRIYKTADGGRTWEQQFVSSMEDSFFDCFGFWNDTSAIGLSDAVDGRLPIVRTENGKDWEVLAGPTAQEGEGGFAASGTCVVTIGTGRVLIGTGNVSPARVLMTTDGGESWTATETPIISGAGAGITTLAFRDELHGAALGGDLSRPDDFTRNVAVTSDGGKTWTQASHPTFAGAVYGSAYVPGTNLLVSVGPGGASYSPDDAKNWLPLDSLEYWSVDFAARSAGWAVGPQGRITRIGF